MTKADVEFDEAVDFSKLRVYRWKESQDQGDNPTARTALLFAIDRGLQDKGLRKTETAAEADLLVRYYTKVERHVKSESTQERSGDIGSSMRTSIDLSRVEDGKLVIDLCLAEDDRRVWRGSFSNTTARGGFTEAEIRRAVRTILAEYPPKTN